jgi:predicted SprT family Zn-dependent metalloprotease
MKNTFAKRTYNCKCGEVAEELVWSNELEVYTFICKNCNAELGYKQLELKPKVESAAIRTPTKNR